MAAKWGAHLLDAVGSYMTKGHCHHYSARQATVFPQKFL